jgi:hypothetical protein
MPMHEDDAALIKNNLLTLQNCLCLSRLIGILFKDGVLLVEDVEEVSEST